jgi:hypothetical protein
VVEPACPARPGWPLERVLFALAGTMTLLTAFVGVNQWLYVVVRACPASIVIRRSLGLRSAIYDQRR